MLCITLNNRPFASLLNNSLRAKGRPVGPEVQIRCTYMYVHAAGWAGGSGERSVNYSCFSNVVTVDCWIYRPIPSIVLPSYPYTIAPMLQLDPFT